MDDSILKKISWLIELRTRSLSYLDYLNYQLQVFEDKTWDIVEGRSRLSNEFAQRSYSFYSRKVNELILEKNELIEDIVLIDTVLEASEEIVWTYIQQESLPKSTMCFFYSSSFFLQQP